MTCFQSETMQRKFEQNTYEHILVSNPKFKYLSVSEY